MKPSLEQQLQEHQAARPEIPRGLPPEHPDFIEWYHAFSKWAERKHVLVCRWNTQRVRA